MVNEIKDERSNFLPKYTGGLFKLNSNFIALSEEAFACQQHLDHWAHVACLELLMGRQGRQRRLMLIIPTCHNVRTTQYHSISQHQYSTIPHYQYNTMPQYQYTNILQYHSMPQCNHNAHNCKTHFHPFEATSPSVLWQDSCQEHFFPPICPKQLRAGQKKRGCGFSQNIWHFLQGL